MKTYTVKMSDAIVTLLGCVAYYLSVSLWIHDFSQFVVVPLMGLNTIAFILINGKEK